MRSLASHHALGADPHVRDPFLAVHHFCSLVEGKGMDAEVVGSQRMKKQCIALIALVFAIKMDKFGLSSIELIA